MSPSLRLSVLLVLSVMSFVSGLSLLWLVGTDVCTSQGQAMEVSKAANCIEFWVNRYQGLIGGVLALIGAGLTVVVVRQQIMTQIDSAARTARIIAIASLREFYAEAEIKHYESGSEEEFQFATTFRFPHLTIADRPDTLAALGPRESEGLFQFAVEVQDARREFEAHADIVGAIDELDYQVRLGSMAQRAARLIDKLNERVGWQEFTMDQAFADSIVRAEAKLAKRRQKSQVQAQA